MARCESILGVEKQDLSVYEVAFLRAQRGWGERERYLRLSPSAPEADPQQVPSCLPGTLATEAYWLWQKAADSLQDGPRRERHRQRAELVRRLVNWQPLPDRLEDALAELLRARVQWLPVLPDSHRILFRWAVGVRHRHEPFPVAAVYLSVLFGLRTKRLKPCAQCSAPFVADTRSERRCPDCNRKRRESQVLARKADWPWVRDRLRKGHHPMTKGLDASARPQVISQAYQELFNMHLDKWRRKWDLKDPRGRGRRRKQSRHPLRTEGRGGDARREQPKTGPTLARR